MPTSLIGRPVVSSLETPTTGQQVEADNILDTAYATSNISGGAPVGWGLTCQRHVINATQAGCYAWTSYDNTGVGGSSKRGFILTFEFLLVASGISGANVNTVALAKGFYQADGTPGNLGNAHRCFRLFLGDGGGFFRFQFLLGEDDGNDEVWVYPGSPGIQLNQVYKIRIVYDIVAGRIEFWVDNVRVGTMSAEEFRVHTTRDMPRQLAHQIIGSSSSSNLTNTEYLLDNIVWSEVPARGYVNLRQRIFAPGLAR